LPDNYPTQAIGKGQGDVKVLLKLEASEARQVCVSPNHENSTHRKPFLHTTFIIEKAGKNIRQKQGEAR
jgi:hypothetical protein